MKSILLSLLYSIARKYFDKDLFERVRALVVSLLSEDIPGDEKRELVRKAIKGEWKDVSTIVVDTIIQLVLLRLNPGD